MPKSKKEFAPALPPLSNFFPFGVPKGKKASFGGPKEKKSFSRGIKKEVFFPLVPQRIFFPFGPPKEVFPFGTPKGKKLLKGGRAGANSFFDFGNFFST